MGLQWGRAALILFLLVASASFSYAENMTAAEVLAPLSENFEKPWERWWWEESNPYIVKAPMVKVWVPGFVLSLDRLEVMNASVMGGKEYVAAVGSGGRAAYVAERLEKARSKLEEAKSRYYRANSLATGYSATLLKLMRNESAQEVGLSGIVEASRLMLGAAVVIDVAESADFVLSFGAEWKRAASAYFEMLGELDAAANAELVDVADAHEGLRKAGAGDGRYAGSAREAYFKTNGFLAEVQRWKLNSTAPRSEEGRAYAAVKEEGDVVAGYLKGSKDWLPFFESEGIGFFSGEVGFTPPVRGGLPKFGELVEKIAGSGKGKIAGNGEGKANLLVLLAGIAKDERDALAQMEREYDAAREEAGRLRENAGEARGGLERERLALVDERGSVLAEGGGGELEVRGSSSAGTFSQRVAGVGAALAESERLSAEAAAVKAGGKDAYLAEAIGLERRAGQRAGLSLLLASSLLEEADVIVERMKEKAAGEIAAAEKETAGVGRNATEEAGRLEALALLEEAKKAFADAESAASAGERFAEYEEAYEKAREGRWKVSEKAAQLASMRDELRLSLMRFEAVLGMAEKDGLDVSGEKRAAEDYREMERSAEFGERTWELLEREIEQRIEAVYEKAEPQYAGLEARRKELVGVMFYFGEELPEGGKKLGEIEEKYAAGGKITARAALGNFAEIDARLRELENAVGRGKGKVIMGRMEVDARTGAQPSTPVLGEKSSFGSTFVFRNRLALGENGTGILEIEYPFAVTKADLGEHSPEIFDIVYSKENGKLAFYFSSVEPYGVYFASIAGSAVDARRGRVSEKALDVSEERAEFEREVWFEAERELEELYAFEEVPEGVGSASADYRGTSAGVELLSDGSSYARLLLEDVQRGKGSFSLRYFVEKPYVIRKESNATGQNGRIEVRHSIVIDGVRVDLETLKVSGTDFANASVGNFRIVPLSGHRVAKEAHASGGGVVSYSFEFENVKRGERAEAVVSYEIDDSEAYAKSMLGSLESGMAVANYSAGADKLADARALVAAGEYEAAIRKMLALQAELEKKKISGEKWKGVFESERSALRGKIGGLEGVARLLQEAGMDDEAKAAGKKIEKAGAKIGDAEKLAVDGDYEGAVGNLREGNAEAAYEIEDALHSRKDELFRRHGEAKKKWLSLALRNESSAGLFDAADEGLKELEEIDSRKEPEEFIALLGKIGSLVSDEEKAAGADEKGASLALAKRLDEYADERGGFGKEAERYGREHAAAKSAGVRYGFPFTPAELEKKLAGIDKRVEAVRKSFEKNGKSAAGMGADAAELEKAVEELGEVRGAVADSLARLGKLANASILSSEAMVGELEGKVKGDEYEAKVRSLKGELSAGRELYSSGMFANSLAYSEKIQKDARGMLGLAKPKEDMAGLLVAGVSVILIMCVAALFLLRKGKAGSERKRLERSG